ncbi:MAG: alpha/beta fold hydrolase [Rhodospirillales bacterium]|nr:alpha/beta fold hydrolase [Rhodospirillales bacterium]
MSRPVSTGGFFALGDSRLEWRRVHPPDAAATPDRPTLVLLHEGLGCVRLWRGFPEALARRTGLGVFLYSRAGYGRSSPALGPLPVDYHRIEALEVLPAVLAAAGVDRPVLVGHSDGGTIALINAGEAEPPALAVVTMAAHVFNEDVTLEGIVAAREAFTGTDLRARLSVYHGNNVDGAFWGWCDAWLSPAFRDWNVELHLPSVTCPVLVIQGEDDHYGTDAQVKAIAGQVSGPAEMLMIADCGHAPHLEQPERACAAIAAFLRTHDIV